MSGVKCELYRFYNDDGSSKDWAIGYQMGSSSSSENKLVVFFGKTGKNLQVRSVLSWYGNPGMNQQREHEKRVDEQLKQGYDHVGSVSIDADTRDIQPLDEHKPEIVPSEPTLYWSNAIAFRGSHDGTQLQDIMFDAAENAGQILNFTKTEVFGSDDFYLTDNNGVKLEFGLQPMNGFNIHGTGTGEVKESGGANVFLLLLHVVKEMRKFNLIGISHLLFATPDNPDAIPVEEFRDLEKVFPLIGLDYKDPELRLLAEKLDLVEPRINFSAISDDSLANEFF